MQVTSGQTPRAAARASGVCPRTVRKWVALCCPGHHRFAGPLLAAAQASGRTLFATWHSRFAPAVEPARDFLTTHAPRAVTVTWKEDVRVWHPGQAWIFEPGGLGVFDPGINALSILTRILPGTLRLKDAELFYPRNCQTPIAAQAAFDTDGTAVHMALDFLHSGTPSWNIRIDTGQGELALLAGGSIMMVNGQAVDTPPTMEYPSLYAHFARLVHSGQSDVDLAPLELVADAFLCGRRVEVEPFIE